MKGGQPSRSLDRPAWDAFIHRYIQTFRFHAITTEDFAEFLEQELPGAMEQVQAAAWLYEPGLPANAPRLHSNHLASIEALGKDAQPPSVSTAASWSALEWQLYVQSLPRHLPVAVVEEIDERYHLSERGNYEVLVPWLTVAVRAGYLPLLPIVQRVLESVGRNKYLKPLYRALVERPETVAFAEHTFTNARHRYHPLTVEAVETILGLAGEQAAPDSSGVA